MPYAVVPCVCPAPTLTRCNFRPRLLSSTGTPRGTARIRAFNHRLYRFHLRTRDFPGVSAVLSLKTLPVCLRFFGIRKIFFTGTAKSLESFVYCLKTDTKFRSQFPQIPVGMVFRHFLKPFGIYFPLAAFGILIF